MARGRQPFTSTDAWIAAGIAVVSCSLAGAVVLSAERVKRDQAELIVKAIAAANHKRQAAGKTAVTGKVDDASSLVADGDIDAQEWDALPYRFSGAEKTKDACILAMASRRTDGPFAAAKDPYRQWGVCATAKGEVAAFVGSCALDCLEHPEPVAEEAPPPPPKPAPAPPPVVAAKPAAPAPVAHSNKIVIPQVEAPALPAEAPKPKTGCSVTGCFGTSCCDEESDSCVSCPGNACCKGLGCGGSCQQEDDCLQGCTCRKLQGSNWGTCANPN